jgi:hypothetical protein
VERCEYFRTFLHDPFNEIESASTAIASKNSHNLSHLHIKNVSKEIFIEVLYFIYTNGFSSEKVFIFVNTIKFLRTIRLNYVNTISFSTRNPCDSGVIYLILPTLKMYTHLKLKRVKCV